MKKFTTGFRNRGELLSPVPAHLARPAARRLFLHPVQADLLRTVALAAMFIDHWAKAFNPAGPPYWTTIVGTVAFPIFLAVSGILASRSRGKGWRRLLTIGVTAIATESIFDMLFDPYFIPSMGRSGTNILFVFLALAATNLIIEGANWSRRLTMSAATGAIYFLFYFATPGLTVGAFGIFGLLTGLGFYLSARDSVSWLPLALIPLLGFSSDPYALIGYCASGLLVASLSFPIRNVECMQRRHWMPRHFFLVAYVGHLLLLLLLQQFV